jgi:hypothetical protein
MQNSANSVNEYDNRQDKEEFDLVPYPSDDIEQKQAKYCGNKNDRYSIPCQDRKGGKTDGIVI